MLILFINHTKSKHDDNCTIQKAKGVDEEQERKSEYV
jgi:hypothetical protein